MNFPRTKSRMKKFIYTILAYFCTKSHSRCVCIIRCIFVQFSMPQLADRILSLATWLKNWLLRAAVRGAVNLSVPPWYIVERSFRARRSYNSLMLSNEPYSRKRGSRFLPFWSGWAHPSFRSRRELRFVSCHFARENGIPLEQRTFRLCVAQGSFLLRHVGPTAYCGMRIG